MIKTSPIHTSRWNLDWYEQWSGFFPPKNWVDFTLIDICGEYAAYKGSCEFSIALLGLRLTVTYVYNSYWNEKIKKEIDEMLE